MINVWWFSRPKRRVTEIPSIIASVMSEAVGQEWSGNRKAHLAIEEALEHEGGLLVDLARAAGFMPGAHGLVLQIGIGNGRADGVRIRVAVADHHDLTLGVGLIHVNYTSRFPLQGAFAHKNSRTGIRPPAIFYNL